jgi:hypothetical protein
LLQRFGVVDEAAIRAVAKGGVAEALALVPQCGK